mmetsp:Transcript_14473/g.31107  ORF Transcript_14473/g.31107 Transcript_14473/m.31107 type:complete len:117 (+) Transcript_14473:3-353(+)
MVLAGTSKTVPLWTPPWVGLPPLVQIGGFLFVMLMIAGVTPMFIKPPEPEPVVEEKPQTPLGVTDDLFAPGRRRQPAPARAADTAAPDTAEETAETELVEEAKPRVSAWQRLKDDL